MASLTTNVAASTVYRESGVRHGYIVGIGSNIDPEHNSLRVLDRLSARFGPLLVSRMYYTDPVGMTSAHAFINFCAFVRTDLGPTQFKGICNQIEVELGRNRGDPGSKTADRPADIDLLSEIGLETPAAAIVVNSPFLIQPAREVVALLRGKKRLPKAKGRLCILPPLGDMPTTVDHDDGAGLIVVG